MNAKKEFKTLFTIAAIWNWSAALLFAFMALFNHTLLGYFLTIIPESFLWYHLFLALVFVYGLGYYWIGNDARRNRDIIRMGIIGKALVFVMLTGGWLQGVITVLTAGAGIVDLVFAVLFIKIFYEVKTTRTK